MTFVPAAPTVAPSVTCWVAIEPPVRLVVQPVGVPALEIEAGKVLLQVAATTGCAHLTATGYVVVQGRRGRAVRTGAVRATDLPQATRDTLVAQVRRAVQAISLEVGEVIAA